MNTKYRLRTVHCHFISNFGLIKDTIPFVGSLLKFTTSNLPNLQSYFLTITIQGAIFYCLILGKIEQ